MADNITDTVSTVPKMPEIPPRKSDRYAKSGEEMMDILVDDIMRYEELSEQSELYALATALAGAPSNTQTVTFQEVELLPEQPLDNNTNEQNDTSSNEHFKKVSLEETDEFLANNVNKNTSYKTKSDMKIFTDWLMANNEFRDVKDIPPIELAACQVLHRYVKNIIFDIYPTLFPRTNIEMWNVSETTTPSYYIYELYFTY